MRASLSLVLGRIEKTLVSDLSFKGMNGAKINLKNVTLNLKGVHLQFGSWSGKGQQIQTLKKCQNFCT